MGPSYHITTLGCPKNQADSRQMERSLLRRGFVRAAAAEDADYHLINSCSFIESARVETIQTVLDAAGLRKAAHPEQKVILAGCFAERYATAVREELPEVDLSFGTGLYHRAGDIVAERFGVSESLSSGVTPSLGEALRGAANAPYAAVKISDGCNRGCAFCSIPSFRGAFRDIALDEILAECRTLTEAEGVREICLVSQDTNRYGGSADRMLELLDRLEELPELRWMRLLYLYPDPRTQELLERAARHGYQKLVPYLESPVQHVSARVLRNMRRFGDYDRFLELFARARELFPDLEVRTSFLIGFPGEEPEDVDLLQRFIEEARPEKLALFAYSLEENTPGFDLGDSISADEKATRINAVRAVHLQLLKQLHAERTGRVYECMIDQLPEPGTHGEILARRAQDAPEVDEVVFLPADPELRPGDLASVEITGFYEYDMTGRLTTAAAHARGRA